MMLTSIGSFVYADPREMVIQFDCLALRCLEDIPRRDADL